MSKLDYQRFKESSLSRTTETPGVTLVAYWESPRFKECQPPEFKEVLNLVETSLRKGLDSTWFNSYAGHVHATVTGLEGKRSRDGRVINDNLAKRLEFTGGVPPAVDFEGILSFLRSSPWPIQLQIGGFRPEHKNPYDPDRHPFSRTFEIRKDGLMVMMGWPLLADGQPFAPLLLGIRKYLERFGVVHKWHRGPLQQDNDLFIVVGEVNYETWAAATMEQRDEMQRKLDAVEKDIREELQKKPRRMPLGLEHLWTVAYSKTTLKETLMAERVSDLDAKQLDEFFPACAPT